MRPLLDRPPRSFLFSPTMTGVGDRAHLATPQNAIPRARWLRRLR